MFINIVGEYKNFVCEASTFYKNSFLGYNCWHLFGDYLEGEDVDMQLGPLELGIILVIVIFLFGVGRIGKIAGELGTGIRSFREGLKGSDDQEKKSEPPAADQTESKE